MVEMFKRWWARLSSFWLGKWLFNKGLGFLIPYTGTISPFVEDVGPGYAKVRMSDKRRTRNHLRCFHAIALANLGELTTGLAVHFGLQNGARAILTNLNIDYFKKARGTITAIVDTDVVKEDSLGPVRVCAQLFNEKQEVVAKVEATWLVGINKAKVTKLSP